MKINAKTGEAAGDEDNNAIFEIFRKENAPGVKKSSVNGGRVMNGSETKDSEPIPEQIF